MTAPHDEPQSFDPGLRLRSLRVVDDDTVEFEFEGINSPDTTFTVGRAVHDGIALWNTDERFAAQYRQVPGPSAGQGLEGLADLFLRIRARELPAQGAYEALSAEVRSELSRRWEESRGDRPANSEDGSPRSAD